MHRHATSVPAQAGLARIATAVVEGAPPPRVLALVAQTAAERLGADRASLVRVEGGRPVTQAVAGAARAVGATALGPAAQAVAAAGGVRLVPAGGRWQGAAGIRGEAGAWGVLQAAGPGPPPPGAEATLADLAEAAAMAVAAIASRERATTDALTGLPNRRAFDERLEAEVARAGRYGRALSLALLDLDRFKAVNDRFGHLGGDAVLRGAAAILAARARVGEVVARFGGEEFAWILPEADLAAAFAAAERARAAVAAAEVPPAGRVTISAGVASLVPGRSAADLLAAADAALYAAKEGGRDQVRAAESGSPPARAPRRGGGIGPLGHRYLRAALATDETALRAVADEAGAAGPVALYDRLLVPVMTEVGDGWEAGRISVGQEHLVTGLSERLVAERRPRPDAQAPPALIACATGNAHRVGLAATAEILAAAGWRPLVLGADTRGWSASRAGAAPTSISSRRRCPRSPAPCPAWRS
ncbi:MAG: diguanylate cyclase [Thermoleophilia bacterium]|nr:diguanylate cyclase [Thermoleophilia bacterium]